MNKVLKTVLNKAFNIDIDKLSNMSLEELEVYHRNKVRDDHNKAYIKFAYLTNYLNFTGQWQYTLVIFINGIKHFIH